MANLQSIFNESGLQGIIPYGFDLDGPGYRFLCDKLKEGISFYGKPSPYGSKIRRLWIKSSVSVSSVKTAASGVSLRITNKVRKEMTKEQTERAISMAEECEDEVRNESRLSAGKERPAAFACPPWLSKYWSHAFNASGSCHL